MHKLVMIFLVSLFLTSCTENKNSDLVTYAANNNYDGVKNLIASGVSVDVLANDGWTALTVAAREGHLEIVELLLKSGAQVNLMEDGGNTALFWAAYSGHENIVQYLLEQKADVNLRCGNCKLPSEAAESRGHSKIAGLLRSKD